MKINIEWIGLNVNNFPETRQNWSLIQWYWFTVQLIYIPKYFYFFAQNTHCAFLFALSEKKVPFSMAIGLLLLLL